MSVIRWSQSPPVFVPPLPENGRCPAEKATPALEGARGKKYGGDEGIRTPGLYVANVPLSHLSYIPTPLWQSRHLTPSVIRFIFGHYNDSILIGNRFFNAATQKH
ncbi:hypothetical protein TRIP_B170091 [uncultured Desulfatiglans sp.]|uniref:Uncharacterized protein n=1 Tax=Uncultured Desulfatiglans sp. TaxID=1748965 RepID=A0A653A176_UNCDX|nr:hypothetical protein TRIP_B170091 [uncultured Desulfatiglans sp.]